MLSGPKNLIGQELKSEKMAKLRRGVTAGAMFHTPFISFLPPYLSKIPFCTYKILQVGGIYILLII